jgi:hypothetical protein
MTMNSVSSVQPSRPQPHPGNENTPAAGRLQTALHPNVYKVAMVCWAGLLAVFWVTFWASASALFVVVVATGFALMFFGIPYIMSRMAAKNAVTPVPNAPGTFGAFLRAPFGTLNGHLSGFEALVQVILVPLCLAVGAVAISFMILADRIAY